MTCQLCGKPADGHVVKVQRKIGSEKENLAELQVCKECAKKIAEHTSCEWNQDEDGWYATSCGELFGFIDGEVDDNRVRFCHRCGRPIKAIKYEEEPQCKN